MRRIEPAPTDEERLIEELLGEVVELRAQVADLKKQPAPVIDIRSRRR